MNYRYIHWETENDITNMKIVFPKKLKQQKKHKLYKIKKRNKQWWLRIKFVRMECFDVKEEEEEEPKRRARARRRAFFRYAYDGPQKRNLRLRYERGQYISSKSRYIALHGGLVYDPYPKRFRIYGIDKYVSVCVKMRAKKMVCRDNQKYRKKI